MNRQLPDETCGDESLEKTGLFITNASPARSTQKRTCHHWRSRFVNKRTSQKHGAI
jgi:hypothetical protein